MRLLKTTLMKTICGLAIMGAIVGVSGCSSTTTPTQYYQLPAKATTKTATLSVLKDPIVIDRIYVADFLAQQGIVYQIDEVQYQAANNHLWMTPLSNQIQMKLKADLSAMLPAKNITTRFIEDWHKKVSVELTAFQGMQSGEAKVAGNWIITNSKGKQSVLPFSCLKPLQADGYANLVETLADCFEQKEFILTQYL